MFYKKIFFTFLASSFLFSLSAVAQSHATDLIHKGMHYHDKKEYTKAIEMYDAALKKDPTSTQAMYELSLTYLMKGNYENALKYSTKVINANYQPLLLDAYNVKGAALANLKNYEDAIKLLTEAVRICGDDYLLYYNLGLSYYKNDDKKKAAYFLERSIDEKVNYPESYFLYAYALKDQGKWLESVLTMDSFLLLSPDDARSKKVFGDMFEILQKKLAYSDAKNLPVGLDFTKVRNALLFVKRNIPTNTPENKYLFFQEATKSILAELKLLQPQDSELLFWDSIVPTYIDILDSGYFNTFCRYISSSAHPDSYKWWKANKNQVDDFINWFESTNGDSDEAAGDEAD